MPPKLEKLAAWLADQPELIRQRFVEFFPAKTHDWFTMSWRSTAFEGPAPKVTVARTNEVHAGVGSDSHPLEVEATIKTPQDFNAFVVMWSLVRKFYPPVWAGHKIYRLTGVPSLPLGNPVRYSNTSQRKATTSWTVLSDPYVAGRSHTQPYDIVLEYKPQGSKHILFDYATVQELCSDIIFSWDAFRVKGRLPYDSGSKNPVTWISLQHAAKQYAVEKEVVLFLNEGEEIHCDWKEVWRSSKARADGGGFQSDAPKFGAGESGVGKHAPGYGPAKTRGPGATTTKPETPAQEPKVTKAGGFASVPDLVFDSPAEAAVQFKVPQPVSDHWGSKYGQELKKYKWFRNGEGVFKFSDGFTVTKGAIVGIKPQPKGTLTTTLIRNKNGETHYVKVAEATALIKQCKYRK